MNNVNFMKMFLAMGEMTQQTKKEKIAYKEKIVFATMRSQIPNWEKPSDWNKLSDDVKLERLTKMQTI